MALMQSTAMEDADILNDTVMLKYNMAAQFTNKAMALVISRCIAGANTQDLCALGDQSVHESTQAVYKTGIERGLAEPTTLNVNNCLSGYSPMESPYVLQVGDVVKISLGTHIDGYTAKGCHTIVIAPTNPEGPLITKSADAIVAAYYASEAVVRLLASASAFNVVNAAKIREVVEEAATSFGVSVVDGSRVRRIRRFLVGQARVEETAMGTDIPKQIEWLQHVPGTPFVPDEEFVVEQGEAWLVDVAMSTGSGKVKEHLTLRPTIFARDVSVTYSMKLKAAQTTLREISNTKSVFPFCLRSLSDQRTARLGISECARKGVVAAYPVLVEHPKEVIARQASTVLLQKSGSSEAVRLTGGAAFKVPWVQSQFEVQEGQLLDQLVNLGSGTRIKEVATTTIRGDPEKMET